MELCSAQGFQKHSNSFSRRSHRLRSLNVRGEAWRPAAQVSTAAIPFPPCCAVQRGVVSESIFPRPARGDLREAHLQRLAAGTVSGDGWPRLHLENLPYPAVGSVGCPGYDVECRAIVCSSYSFLLRLIPLAFYAYRVSHNIYTRMPKGAARIILPERHRILRSTVVGHSAYAR